MELLGGRTWRGLEDGDILGLFGICLMGTVLLTQTMLAGGSGWGDIEVVRATRAAASTCFRGSQPIAIRDAIEAAARAPETARQKSFRQN